MKIRNLLFILPALFVLMAGFTSCGPKSPSALVAHCERIDGEFAKVAENSPMFLSSASCAYADGVITVDVVFADTAVKASSINEALAEWIVSRYLKSHQSAELADVLNTLGKEEGAMVLNLSSPAGEPVQYTFTAARLKKLFQIRQSELRQGDARNAMNELLAARCPFYAENVAAVSAEYEFMTGFAQYTITFKDVRQISNQTPGVLQGRYRRVLGEQFAECGECDGFVRELLKSLGYEGFRYIYIADGTDRKVRTAIAWRYIE